MLVIDLRVLCRKAELCMLLDVQLLPQPASEVSICTIGNVTDAEAASCFRL